MIKAVIFDMDGVLIDSVEIGFQARKKLLAQYGVDLETIPDPQGENHRAASLKMLLASVKAHSGIDIDYDEFARISRERMRSDLQEHGVSADPHLITFLNELKERGIKCAIVSSGLREGVDIKLDVLGIGQYFTTIVTGSDVSKHKPNPHPYLFALKKLALSPEDCVVFEDSATGVQAALAAGCKVVGFMQYAPPAKPLLGVVAMVKNWQDVNYDKLEAIL